MTEECHESDMAGMMIMMIMIMVVSLYTSPICISVSSSIVDAKYQRHRVFCHLIDHIKDDLLHCDHYNCDPGL